MKEQINGIEIYYETYGMGEPVVFLNGIMMTVQSWYPQIQFFMKEYKLILHDFRGQLMSEKPESEYSMEIHAADLKALLDRLGIRKCHIVGTSYGGVVGMIFSYTYPELVKSLSLIATFSNVSKVTSSHIESWIEVALKCPGSLYNIATDRVFSDRFRTEKPEYIEAARTLFKALSYDYFNSFVKLASAAGQVDIPADKIGNIRCPTLVIAAENDILLPECSRKIAETIPDSEFVIVPDAGHAVVIEKADVINTILYGFLSKNKILA
ncbi:MAG: hypothetical protein BWK80_34915 [Desulfobacteraceae bacterium IS3]|nr:MAG: hypothetical protein BWK80_34915 [Desulfobacteraceae bacterium IS3]